MCLIFLKRFRSRLFLKFVVCCFSSVTCFFALTCFVGPLMSAFMYVVFMAEKPSAYLRRFSPNARRTQKKVCRVLYVFNVKMFLETGRNSCKRQVVEEGAMIRK